MKYKDYYKILGLKSHKVTADEIKSAYRKLAKKYHPDINPGNLQAAERFKDVNEAYQVLIDEDSKRKYNRKHIIFSFREVVNINTIKSKIDSSGASEFIEMFIGKTQTNNIKTKKCESKSVGENLESLIDITLEEAFNGVNKKISFKDSDDKMRNITVKIPSGIVNGGKIRIKGQGKKGKNGGLPGDLLIKINILEDKRFKLEKSDLIIDLPITPSEAVLGCNINVETIDSQVSVEVKPGVASNELIFIDNSGYFDENGKRGRLIVKPKIVVPKEISTQERELYKKLQKITSFMPR